jgi:hypothetical protein
MTKEQRKDADKALADLNIAVLKEADEIIRGFDKDMDPKAEDTVYLIRRAKRLAAIEQTLRARQRQWAAEYEDALAIIGEAFKAPADEINDTRSAIKEMIQLRMDAEGDAEVIDLETGAKAYTVTRMGYDVVDKNALPQGYRSVDRGAISKYLRACVKAKEMPTLLKAKEMPTLPGVEFKETKSVEIR